MWIVLAKQKEKRSSFRPGLMDNIDGRISMFIFSISLGCGNFPSDLIKLNINAWCVSLQPYYYSIQYTIIRWYYVPKIEISQAQTISQIIIMMMMSVLLFCWVQLNQHNTVIYIHRVFLTQIKYVRKWRMVIVFFSIFSLFILFMLCIVTLHQNIVYVKFLTQFPLICNFVVGISHIMLNYNSFNRSHDRSIYPFIHPM